jgi:hypothetical protein
MKQDSGFMRWTSRLMMVCMLSFGIQTSAFAAMVSTEDAVDHAQAAQVRAKIITLIERQDISAQLQSKGVTHEQAIARVNALSDEEVIQVSGRLDQLPAGGDVLGLLFTVFIVLLVTDILGFTKVFPFTHTIKR